MGIRAIEAGDGPEWSGLWAGYTRFYRARLPESVTEATFARLMDPEVQPYGLVATDGDGHLLGFAHYLFHPTTWAMTDVCYLQDLFVDPEARGGGIGRGLIEAVCAAAEAKGAAKTYWMTQEFNAEARALYDTLARRTSFIRYER
jgi:GNAT superfamily N-acetyltransferase